ncbi:MATE family efflux transporter [Enterococcus timonensis]|uniref:MATE family efflux transporter n=1 Tax=Enterococcus timonensis TaxID=1852364 RepID=UPI0008DA76F5|nr:MATE family efflux transporter [Enterococcus timonensis]
MQDMTQGRPYKLIFAFTIPLFIGNLFQQFYNIADTLIVGRTLGENALAAVGSTGSINFLIIGFAQGLTAGLSIITAQRFGAKDSRGVRKSFATSIIISGIVAIVLTIFSVLFVRQILELMQTPTDIINQAEQFIKIIFMGIPASITFNLLSNMLRALGDSRTPLFFLVIASVVNIVLDLVLITQFQMGVAGAGVATVTAQIVASLCCAYYIYKKVPLLHVRKKDFTLVKKEWQAHLAVGFPMAFQSSIIAIGSIALQTALNNLGTQVVAANTAAGRIDQFATQPMASFGIAMATFTAQNLGAKKYRRIIQGVKECLIMSGAFSIVAGALIIIFANQLVSLFLKVPNPEILHLSRTYFIINGSMYLLLAVLFIIRYTLQGLGKGMIPTLAGIAELLMRTLAAIFLAQAFGYPGAASANPLAWLGSLLVLIPSYVKAVRQLNILAEEQNRPEINVQ